MCGLWGAFSSPGLSDAEINNVLDLGYFSGLRGFGALDSTGLYVLGKTGDKWEYRCAKEVLPVPIFVMDKEIKKDWDRKDIRVMLGHARQATIGEITKEMAAPHIQGDIVLTHNGTIEAFVKNKHDPKASDSKEFARRLDQYKKNIEPVLWQADAGAYAIAMLNYHDYSLTLARNGSRSLYMMFNEAKNTVYWASEYWMLAAMRAKTSLKMDTIDLLSIDTMYRWNVNSMKMETIELEKPKPRPTEVPKGKLFQTPMFCKDCKKRSEYCSCQKTLPMLPGPKQPLSSCPVIPKKDAAQHAERKWVYKGFRGTISTVNDRVPHLRNGCAACKVSMTPRDKVFWFAPNFFFCDDCHENSPIVAAQVKSKHSTWQGELMRVQ